MSRSRSTGTPTTSHTGIRRQPRPPVSAAASACSTFERPIPPPPLALEVPVGGVKEPAGGSSMVGGPALRRPAYAGGWRYPPPADGGAYGDGGPAAAGGGVETAFDARGVDTGPAGAFVAAVLLGDCPERAASRALNPSTAASPSACVGL